MDAEGYDSDSPTVVAAMIADVGGDEADMPMDEVVETLFSGTDTEGATPRSTISSDPHGTEETGDHPARGSTDDQETIGSDSEQQATAPSVDRTLFAESTSGMTSTEYRREKIPGFTILLKLGRGGMGVVYKAEQHPLKRMVALKMIHPGRHDNPSDIARFMFEAEAVGQLEHPNIVKIFHFGEAEGGPFFALELLEGGSLADRLKGAPQPVRESATLVATLARAVDAAHAAKIMHRDLKPSNVLYDADGVPKITDFGLARRLEVDDGETRAGQVIGTPSYMSPEQATGWDKEIGRGADIYSLGVILYEMLTGRPPLKGMNPEETIKLVREKEPVPPSKIRPNIPYDLETVCLKCLEKTPAKRYATAIELAEDLDRFLAGKPVLARRTPFWERGIKLVKRHPLATTLLTLGILGSGATAVGLAKYREETRIREENAAVAERDRINGKRKIAVEGLSEVREALGAKRWADAQVRLAGLRTEIKSEPLLAETMQQAEELLKRANDGDAKAEAEAETRAKFAQFRDARDAAFFLDTRFDGRPEKNTSESIAQAARAGLGIFGKTTLPSNDEWSPPVIPPSLSPQERDEVAVGFYELLLILADAVSGQTGANPSQRADSAIKILDRAAALRSPATRAEHLHRAAYLELKGESDAAARLRQEAEKVPPADAFDFFLIGRLLALRPGGYSSAIRYFEDATRSRPDHFRARCLLAFCYIQTKQASKAIPLLTACLRDKPGSVQLHMLRGSASVVYVSNARELARGSPAQANSLKAMASRHLEDAEDDYRKALELLGNANNPEGIWLRYAVLHNRGLIRLERQDPTSAATDFHEAIRLDGERYEAYSGLAEVDRRQGRTDEALGNFTKAIGLRPEYAPLYRGRAEVLIGLKELSPERLERALRDLDEAIRLEPPGSGTIVLDRSNQALLLQRAERFEEALKACDAALQIAPKYAPTHLIRIELLLELKRHEELLGSCNAALDPAPASAESAARLHELRGMAKDALGKFSGAIEDYSLSLSRRPDDPRVLLRRGLSYLANDAFRLAVDDFDRVLELAPRNAEAHAGRGFALVRLGDSIAAVDAAEEAVRLDDTSWRIAYNAARVYGEAALAISSNPRKARPEDVTAFTRYQNRAWELIKRALERIPVEKRGAFRETLQADPALRPIRRRLG